MNVRIGLDIGGTKTAARAVAGDGHILAEVVRPTDVSRPDCLVAGIVHTVDAALAAAGVARADLVAAGVGVPGQVDPADGTVRLAVNLNLREPYPLRDALQTALGVPVTLENDVRAAAWGAFNRLGAERPLASLAYLSIGTGIAAGIVLDGRLYRGAAGMAGEIGHIPLDATGPRCSCGSYGCLEVFAAGPAIAAQAAGVLSGADSRPLDAGEVYALSAQGNPAARQLVARAASYLARAIYLLVMTCDVERVALGGGVTRAGAAFECPLRDALAALRDASPLAAMMLPENKVAVLPADFSAGLTGAVLLTNPQARLSATA